MELTWRFYVHCTWPVAVVQFVVQVEAMAGYTSLLATCQVAAAEKGGVAYGY